jgi:hypothetical protein
MTISSVDDVVKFFPLQASGEFKWVFTFYDDSNDKMILEVETTIYFQGASLRKAFK